MKTAREAFDEWNDITGCIPKGTSYYYEIISVMEDHEQSWKASLEIANARLWHFRSAAKFLQRTWCISPECGCMLCQMLQKDAAMPDPRDEEIRLLKASSEVMHVALENAVKRSTYEWSSGPHYTVRDFMNEGRIEIAKELLKKLEAQKTPSGSETDKTGSGTP